MRLLCSKYSANRVSASPLANAKPWRTQNRVVRIWTRRG